MKIDPSGIEAGEEIEKAVGDLMKTSYGDVAQPLLKSIGKTFALAWEAGVDLPVRFWSEKRKALFSARLKHYYEEIAKIEEEHLCEVPPEIGVPILERLSYVQADDIADKFINLLTTASSDETIGLAHPRFVSIIDSLSADEAKMLNFMYRDKSTVYPSKLKERLGLTFSENILLYGSSRKCVPRL